MGIMEITIPCVAVIMLLLAGMVIGYLIAELTRGE